MTTTHENVESPTERASRSPFIDFGSAPGSESELTIESIRERADATSEVLERIMQRERMDILTPGDKNMKRLVAKALIWTALVVGVGLLPTSCTTSGNWSPDLPEKGSAKGGASLLMKR